MKHKDYLNRGRIKPVAGNRINLVIFLIVILGILLVFCLLFHYCFSVLEKKEIYAKVILSDHYGFDINGTALIFGMTTPGGSASKEVTLENNYGRDVKVQFLVRGDIADFMKISENNFILGKNEGRNVTFTISTPSSSKYGVYEGKVIVIIRKA